MCKNKEEGISRSEHWRAHLRITPSQDILLILYCDVDVKMLQELGKGYLWPRPAACPFCTGIRVWRHGFVLRYFDDMPEQLWMLKYLCADCGSVHTMRPTSYDRRIRVPWIVIFQVLLLKILLGRWAKDFSKERQRYWMKGFRLHACSFGNISETVDQLKTLGELVGRVILGTHSTRFFETKPYRDPPHLIFRLTPESRLP